MGVESHGNFLTLFLPNLSDLARVTVVQRCMLTYAIIFDLIRTVAVFPRKIKPNMFIWCDVTNAEDMSQEYSVPGLSTQALK